VSQGVVRLSGHVGSAAERTRAATDAWVTGVTAVDVGRVEVSTWAARPEVRKSPFPAVSDSDIAHAIEDAARYDPRVDPEHIRAEVHAGLVTLHGTVGNLQAKRAIASLASHTVGVVQVRNEVQVRSEKSLTDHDAAERIRAALVIDPVTAPAQIQVRVENGRAILSGAADNYFVAAEADSIAAGVEGINEIDDRLEIDHPSSGYAFWRYMGPYGDAFESWTYLPGASMKRSDQQIACDIQRALNASPFVDPDEVSVSVRDGTATLTGSVDSWRERNAATDDALEGGALAVYNELRIE
jgi:osmotically-inducible protein OsmY